MMSEEGLLRPSDQTNSDVNINDFQDKFAGYGFYRFSNLPA